MRKKNILRGLAVLAALLPSIVKADNSAEESRYTWTDKQGYRMEALPVQDGKYIMVRTVGIKGDESISLIDLITGQVKRVSVGCVSDAHSRVVLALADDLSGR